MPSVLIIAGPNGAGKTTFMRRWWPVNAQDHEFVNADEIARELASDSLAGPALDLAAGRVMLERLESLSAARSNLVVETTLATLTYARRIKAWRGAGYFVTLVYLRLPDVEASIARVAKRVSLGGHNIPEADLRRRFPRSLENLEVVYKPIVDEWEVWGNLSGGLSLLEASYT